LIVAPLFLLELEVLFDWNVEVASATILLLELLDGGTILL